MGFLVVVPRAIVLLAVEYRWRGKTWPQELYHLRQPLGLNRHHQEAGVVEGGNKGLSTPTWAPEKGWGGPMSVLVPAEVGGS